jgi:hypothetical protein
MQLMNGSILRFAPQSVKNKITGLIEATYGAATGGVKSLTSAAASIHPSVTKAMCGSACLHAPHIASSGANGPVARVLQLALDGYLAALQWPQVHRAPAETRLGPSASPSACSGAEHYCPIQCIPCATAPVGLV